MPSKVACQDLLHRNQYACRKLRVCELLKCQTVLAKLLDENQSFDLKFDFESAPQAVSHTKLMKFLPTLRVDRKIMNPIIPSDNHVSRVSLIGASSGWPQGTVLDRLCYILYVNSSVTPASRNPHRDVRR